LTHWITAVSGRFKHAAGLSALALVAFLVLALSTREWTPIADETQYLTPPTTSSIMGSFHRRAPDRR
jgi:hypothetical protein